MLINQHEALSHAALELDYEFEYIVLESVTWLFLSMSQTSYLSHFYFRLDEVNALSVSPRSKHDW